MADLYSTEYANVNSNKRNSPNTEGEVHYMSRAFTGTALTTSDTLYVAKMPNGARILPQSLVIISDLEVSASVNVGYAAYTANDGSSVAADPDAFISALDASSARTKTNFDESQTHDDGYTFTGEGDLTLTLAAGTSVAADTFNFHIMYTLGGE